MNKNFATLPGLLVVLVLPMLPGLAVIRRLKLVRIVGRDRFKIFGFGGRVACNGSNGPG